MYQNYLFLNFYTKISLFYTDPFSSKHKIKSNKKLIQAFDSPLLTIFQSSKGAVAAIRTNAILQKSKLKYANKMVLCNDCFIWYLIMYYILCPLRFNDPWNFFSWLQLNNSKRETLIFVLLNFTQFLFSFYTLFLVRYDVMFKSRATRASHSVVKYIRHQKWKINLIL